MSHTPQFLSPSEAARRLGVSTKTLRIYERHGLISPIRTEAGWRTYGPPEMARAAEIVALRALRLSLAQIAQVLTGDPRRLDPVLAAHQAVLEDQSRNLAGAIEKVRAFRTDLAGRRALDAEHLLRTVPAASRNGVRFSLPWPWGGERFELNDIRPLTYITGPLGSGKTRLAKTIADALPGAAFLGLERLADKAAAARSRLDADPALKSRVDRAGAGLAEQGATVSAALVALLAALETGDAGALVVDVIEQDLDQATQEALIGCLRQRSAGSSAVFLLTRSSSILDMASMSPNECIIYCPANHQPPIEVAPYPGAPGYESVTTCLAPPHVRARTEGVIAWRPKTDTRVRG